MLRLQILEVLRAVSESLYYWADLVRDFLRYGLKINFEKPEQLVVGLFLIALVAIEFIYNPRRWRQTKVERELSDLEKHRDIFTAKLQKVSKGLREYDEVAREIRRANQKIEKLNQELRRRNQKA